MDTNWSAWAHMLVKGHAVAGRASKLRCRHWTGVTSMLLMTTHVNATKNGAAWMRTPANRNAPSTWTRIATHGTHAGKRTHSSRSGLQSRDAYIELEWARSFWGQLTSMWRGTPRSKSEQWSTYKHSDQWTRRPSRSRLQSWDIGAYMNQSEQETCEDDSCQRHKDHLFKNWPVIMLLLWSLRDALHKSAFYLLHLLTSLTYTVTIRLI